MDLHSQRSTVDREGLIRRLADPRRVGGDAGASRGRRLGRRDSGGLRGRPVSRSPMPSPPKPAPWPWPRWPAPGPMPLAWTCSSSTAQAASLAAPAPERLLILGGTAEGRALAEAATVRFGPSLDGNLGTRRPHPCADPAGRRPSVSAASVGWRAWRHFPAGGSESRLLIDATHPYATQISAQARTRRRCRRGPNAWFWCARPWQPVPGDRWIDCCHHRGGGRSDPDRRLRRVFLTVGAPLARALRRPPRPSGSWCGWWTSLRSRSRWPATG